MKLHTRQPTTLALLSGALLTFASCSSTPSQPKVETSSVTKTEPGVPGGVVVDTYTMTANVTAVDAAGRTVTLLTPDGKTSNVKCGPEVANFDQIRVGDQVKVTLTEELAIHMASDAAPSSDDTATVVALAPKGAKPAARVASTRQVIATVTAIDLGQRKATLRFPDGSTRTVAVRKDIDLTQRRVGEQVVIRLTEALAISVDRP